MKKLLFAFFSFGLVSCLQDEARNPESSARSSLSEAKALQLSSVEDSIRDDFSKSGAPDPSLWVTLDGAGNGIQNDAGYLVMQGSPYHKRLNTIQAFSPGDFDMDAEAVLSVSGDYQKFGFNVNMGEDPGGSGFYFDTYEPAYGGRAGYIRAIVFVSGQLVMEREIPAAWNSFHTFGVRWSPTRITFRIDNQTVATFDASLANPLPLGLWNDRTSSMTVDRVSIRAR